MTCETRPMYILKQRAQALDRVQELIAPGDGPWVDPPLPTQEQWDAIVQAAFPPPPMASGVTPMTSEPSDTLYAALEDAIWQALDSEQGMPHSGVDPAYVIPAFLRLLREAGYGVVRLVSGNPIATKARDELIGEVRAAIANADEHSCDLGESTEPYLDVMAAAAVDTVAEYCRRDVPGVTQMTCNDDDDDDRRFNEYVRRKTAETVGGLSDFIRRSEDVWGGPVKLSPSRSDNDGRMHCPNCSERRLG